MRRRAFALGIVAVPLAAPRAAAAARSGRLVRLPDGLEYVDLAPGHGPRPKAGDTVTVTYVGRLADGTIFDASAKHGGTFDFTLGRGQVIRGWDEGVATMRAGGRRRLIVPPALGYGEQGAGGLIPPNATLTFVIELLRFRT